MSLLYVVCQNATRAPDLRPWIDDAWSVICKEPEWRGWQIRVLPADNDNTFSAEDFYSVVAESLGPVLVLGSLKRSAVALLAKRIGMRCVVTHTEAIGESTDVYGAIESALGRHEAGEPQLPARLVVAVLIVRKLIRYDYWGGGAKSKAFLYADDLPKGRGIDESLGWLVPEVANQLVLKELLITKRSQGQLKIALNPMRRRDLFALVESYIVSDQGLETYLFGSRQTLSARWLD